MQSFTFDLLILFAENQRIQEQKLQKIKKTASAEQQKAERDRFDIDARSGYKSLNTVWGTLYTEEW